MRIAEGLGFPWRPVEAGRIAGWVVAGREHLGGQAQPAWDRGAGLSIEAAAAMARRGAGPASAACVRMVEPHPC